MVSPSALRLSVPSVQGRTLAAGLPIAGSQAFAVSVFGTARDGGWHIATIGSPVGPLSVRPRAVEVWIGDIARCRDWSDLVGLGIPQAWVDHISREGARGSVITPDSADLAMGDLFGYPPADPRGS